jgi:hypothetical protein
VYACGKIEERKTYLKLKLGISNSSRLWLSAPVRWPPEQSPVFQAAWFRAISWSTRSQMKFVGKDLLLPENCGCGCNWYFNYLSKTCSVTAGCSQSLSYHRRDDTAVCAATGWSQVLSPTETRLVTDINYKRCLGLTNFRVHKYQKKDTKIKKSTVLAVVGDSAKTHGDWNIPPIERQVVHYIGVQHNTRGKTFSFTATQVYYL